eukprot:CAMPEP_0119044426 /NCGR_PEP_ID=MMETSP1177-20130426/31359_1 /TAXON_ID=2985 /ORGANISM="Ochromonas sp, Strain CCMP1899" /LENGTH=208 /DNA_ID=CAMNT_0007014515 /DNA_START=145 /DNA_END=767 /DNA_ORIENTATION=+
MESGGPMTEDLKDSLDDDISEDLKHAPALLYSWGRSDTDSLLTSPNDSSAVDGVHKLTFANQRTIVQICSNLYHCAAVTSTGELYTCGDNTEGQVQPSGVVKAEDAPQGEKRPKIVEELGNHRIHSVSCGLYHTVCVTASGLAISYGGNEAGQCGHSGSIHTKVKPKMVDFHGNGSVIVKQIACGDLFTVFLSTTGEVYTCGVGSYMG